VIVDVSATWCGPCWNFHNSHALEKLYQAYGPGGSDQIVVLFIEGDDAQSVNTLYGINDSPRPTMGDWTDGASYPIIDSGAIANTLAITSFPTCYRICPDGTVFYFNPSAGLLNFDTIVDNITENCGLDLQAPENHVAAYTSGELKFCEAGEAGDVDARIVNYGSNAITSATVELRNGETVVATQTFEGNLSQFSDDEVTFEGVVFEEGGNYSVHITNVNGGAAFNPEVLDADVNFSIANTGENNMVEVVVYTDTYAHEASWLIKDSSGVTVAEGGDYMEGDDDEFGAGGPDANTDHHYWITLPGESPECFRVILKDAFGDGWIYSAEGSEGEKHGIEIYSDGEMIYQNLVGNFGTQLSTPNAFRTMGVLGTEDVEADTFAVYPNPTSGVLNFNTQEPVSVTVTDLSGKVVFTAKDINNGDAVNLGSLQTGMYIAKINGATSERVEKIMIK
ncbi:MAG TPA: T9SS type A sorting domain-containing protein, partial [Flavobacterium sp.]|nr:T9SS type A sorting domain-containing protein [Flavobacterium sp.]